MSDQIGRRWNGKHEKRRRGGRSLQLPDWFMILHSSPRHLCTCTYVLRRTNYIRRKKKKKKPGGQVSGWTCRTCAQIFRVYLLKTAWIFRLQCGKHGYFTQLLVNTWFQCRIKSLRCVQLTTQHRQVRSSNVCVKLFTDMPWSTCSRLVQKKGRFVFFLPRKRPTIFDLFDGMWSVGTRFRRQRHSQVL